MVALSKICVSRVPLLQEISHHKVLKTWCLSRWSFRSTPCFVSALQVKLYKSDNLDNPIQTVSLGQSLFFHFPPLLRDGQVSPLHSALSLLE